MVILDHAVEINPRDSFAYPPEMVTFVDASAKASLSSVNLSRNRGPVETAPRPFPSVDALLRGFRDKRGWRGVGDEPLLELARDGSRVTLEPGAQIELSGRPHARLADAESELAGYLAELRGVSDELGIVWLPVGIERQPGERLEPQRGVARGGASSGVHGARPQ